MPSKPSRKHTSFSPNDSAILYSLHMFTLPKTNIAPKKCMVGRRLSFWKRVFSGAMLVFGRVKDAYFL